MTASKDSSTPSHVALAEASVSTNAPGEYPKPDAKAVVMADEHIIPATVQPVQLSEDPSDATPHTGAEEIPPV
ncbi:hypothetical protein CORC01_04198 [Colletotrichum orchidophilum]|uniref:Uncharacterized protein n=1 Tax=Colletotrichum orchidophilum TaxID=1209926 RepID=A0A1G4BGH0_9PEZI|nr:uncharacterized protein CORC01_04198 [Colletotrichum orchidophilum]OHF00448.1 hypothetical protein CORC01_04198 [Colletotrichum orchidophilum]